MQPSTFQFGQQTQQQPQPGTSTTAGFGGLFSQKQPTAATPLRPVFGATAAAPTATGFGGGTTGATFGSFGGGGGTNITFGTPAPAANSFGVPQMASTPFGAGGTAQTQTGTQSIFGAKPGGGSLLNTGGQTGSIFGSTTQQLPGFSGFGAQQQQQQQQSSFNFGASAAGGGGGSGIFAKQPATGFNFGQPQQQPQLQQPQQQQQQQLLIDEQTAIFQSIFHCSKFGDERDGVLANFNLIQSVFGTGQGYYNPNHPPVLYSDKSVFYRFKSVGYSFMYTDSNEDGQVVIQLKRPQIQPGSSEESVFISGLQTLVGKPNILFRICGSKESIGEEISEIILIADDKTTMRRVLATDLADCLKQSMLKPHLDKLGVVEVCAKVRPGHEQLKAYLENAPAGIDPRVWRKAQEDNPDPENMIPFPLIGPAALKQRLDAQKKESIQHQERLKLIGEEVTSISNRHVNMNSELKQMRRRLTNMSHRVLYAILRHLLLQLKDIPVQPGEEAFRKQLASLQINFNSSKDLRGRLNLLIQSVPLQQRKEKEAGGGGGDVGGGGENLNNTLLDSATFENVKQVLIVQQQSLKHLVETVKSDIDCVKKMDGTVSQFNSTGLWK